MKTTIDIPDDLLRLAKARASLSGISLRQFVTDMLRSQLAHEHQQARPTDPPWMRGFCGWHGDAARLPADKSIPASRRRPEEPCRPLDSQLRKTAAG
jgi:hypothetical protein